MRKKAFEIWKAIQNYEGLYEVSNWGRVKSLERDVIIVRYGKPYVRHRMERILEQYEDKDGYVMVSLSKNGVRESKTIHKLVATAFIPNPNGYTNVHHINHDHKDNRVENLMWIDRYEHHVLHQNDRASAAKETLSKRVDQINKVTGEVLRQWDSVMDAARELGLCPTHISKCAQGKRKTHGNFVWKYVLE